MSTDTPVAPEEEGYFVKERQDIAERPDPVSYTHLTLPTILLV